MRLLFVLLFAPFLAPGADDGVYRVRAGFRTTELVGKFRYVERSEPLLVIHADNALLRQFRPVPSAVPIFRDRTNWYCVYFRLRNESRTALPVYLQIDNPVIDSLQLLFCDNRGCHVFPMESVVDPARQVVGTNLRHQYPITLAPGQDYAVFVNLANRLSFQRLRLSVQLTETNYLPTFDFRRLLFEKMYVGTLFFVILFTLTSLFIFGERIYLHYLIYLCGLAFLFVSRENYLVYFSSEKHFFTNTWLILGAAYNFMFLGYTGFARAFLNARTFAPKWLYNSFTHLLRLTLLLMSVFIIGVTAGYNLLWLGTVTMAGLIVASIAILWVFAYFALRHQYKPAYLFCIGFLPLFLYVFFVETASEAGYSGNNRLPLFYSIHIFELFALTVGLIVRFKISQTEKETLQREIVDQRQSRLETIIQTQETERQRIATDLHDDLGGTLATIRQRLATMQQHTADGATRQAFTDLEPLIQKSSHDLRRIAHNLMPPEFSRLGLHGAIEQLVRNIPVQPTRFEFVASGTIRSFQPDVELNIYRIVSELMQNVQKHAGAKRASVQLLYEETGLSVLVDDDGRGISREKLVSGTGIGLKNSMLRAAHIGATLQSETGKGGTFVVLEIPYTLAGHTHASSA